MPQGHYLRQPESSPGWHAPLGVRRDGSLDRRTLAGLRKREALADPVALDLYDRESRRRELLVTTRQQIRELSRRRRIVAEAKHAARGRPLRPAELDELLGREEEDGP